MGGGDKLTKPEASRKWASRRRDGAENKEKMGKQGWVETGSPGRSEFFREATPDGPDAWNILLSVLFGTFHFLGSFLKCPR